MEKVFILMLLMLIGLSACRNNKDFTSEKDGMLTVKAIRNKKENLIKIRLSFDQYEKGMDIQQFAKTMQYEMDSNFYLLQHNEKQYPLYITPIANGMDKTFEYIIGFDENVKADTLVYIDRYRSKKSIILTF